MLPTGYNRKITTKLALSGATFISVKAGSGAGADGGCCRGSGDGGSSNLVIFQQFKVNAKLYFTLR